MSDSIKTKYKYIYDGSTLTKADLFLINRRIDEVNDAINRCTSKDTDVLLNLHSEVSALLDVLETAMQNHPDHKGNKHETT